MLDQSREKKGGGSDDSDEMESGSDASETVGELKTKQKINGGSLAALMQLGDDVDLDSDDDSDDGDFGA